MSKKSCKICQTEIKKSSDIYCSKHQLAKSKLQKGYDLWLKAYGVLPYENYLQKLLKLENLVGSLVKDVAEFELYFQVSK